MKGLIPIDARNLRILMDINSLQSFGAVQSYANNNSTPNLFTNMLNEVLGSSSNKLTNTITDSDSLKYSGNNRVFEPSMLASMIVNKSDSPTLSYRPSIKDGKYTTIIKQAAMKYDIPEDLIASVIQQESNFKNDVVSKSGAQGLMQLMPGTAKFLGVKDSFDPVQNITGGARYLRQMLDQFNGNIELALAAYNAGPGNVKKYDGIPPFKETQNYVKKVLNTFHS